MIGDRDRIELAPGVRVDGNRIVDDVRTSAIALNASAAVALHARTPEEMADALRSAFGVERSRAVSDARVLCTTLNAALLVNVRVSTARIALRWLALTLTFAPLRRLPSWPASRRRLDTTSAGAAITTVVRGTAGAALGAACLVALPLLVVARPSAAVAAGCAAAAGVAMHEAAHAVALRGVRAALIVRGVRVSILHPSLDARREAFVAATGPLAPAAMGVLLLALATEARTATAVPACLVLALHAMGLTAIASDGRKLCAAC